MKIFLKMIETTWDFPPLHCRSPSEPEWGQRTEVGEFDSLEADQIAEDYESYFDEQDPKFWRNCTIIDMIRTPGIFSLYFLNTVEKTKKYQIYLEKCNYRNLLYSEEFYCKLKNVVFFSPSEEFNNKLSLELTKIKQFFLKDSLTQSLTIILFNGKSITWNK